MTVGGIRGNTHFLACFDVATVGSQVFPPWTEPGDDFLAGRSDGVSGADPLIYFVFRGLAVRGDEIDWESTTPLWIDAVFEGEDGSLGLLLDTTVRLDLRSVSPTGIDGRPSVGGDLPRLLEKRAAARGVSADSPTTRFLADSMVSVAVVRDGITLTGEFRDVTGEMPPRWEEWANSR